MTTAIEQVAPQQAPKPATLKASAGKRRRSPLFYVVCIGLALLGAVISGYAWLASADAEKVLAVRETVHRGEMITDGDLQSVSISQSAGLKALPASELSTVVGKRAALDLAAGTLVTTETVAESVVPRAGESVVGLALTAAQMPARPLLAGDEITIVGLSEQGGTLAETPNTLEATVVGVSAADPTDQAAQDGAATVVDIEIKTPSAATVAAAAAAGHIAVVLNSREK